MRTALLAGTAVAGGALLYYLYRQRRCRQPKLVLHFDVNETIMVGDPAGGDSFEDCLNKMICKNALVRAKKPGADPLKAQSVSELVWWDGTPMLEQGAPAVGEHVPPLRGDWVWPDGCVPFYKVKALKKQTNGGRAFTQPGSPGCIYRAQLEELEQALRVPEGARAGLDPRLCHDGVHWFLLPSFFHTLHALHAAGRDFAVVIRTFGTDGTDVARALSAWAAGAHPAVPGVPSLAVDPEATWRVAYADDGSVSVLPEGSAGGRAPLGEGAAVAAMEARGAAAPTAMVCADHYKWWAAHSEAASAGKPLWLTLDDDAVHHLFFDDNLNNDPQSSIVATRVRDSAAAPFRPAPGAATRALHGVCVCKCPTFEAVLDPQWFLRQIDAAERTHASAPPVRMLPWLAVYAA